MSTRALLRQVGRLEAAAGRRRGGDAAKLEALRADPTRLLTDAGMRPDPWQERLLRSDAPRMLLLCSRQAGKSLTAAGLALRTALLRPGSLTLLVSPTLRQSGELFRDKVLRLYAALGRPVRAAQESALQLTLSNGSRVVSLPGTEANIRGFSSVALLVIDEAARVPDPLYLAVRPMLAVSGGALVALSSAYAKLGWFYDAWESREAWERVRITAHDCPRISPAFLAEERAALGERWYAMEYECRFGDRVGALFSQEDIAAACVSDIPPLWS